MPLKINNLVTALGGKYNKKAQLYYINDNQWNNVDPTLRKGAWTNNHHDSSGKIIHHGLGGGVCLGLSCAYLISGKTWPAFLNYIDSSQGKAPIRGLHNMQYERFLLQPNGPSKFRDLNNISYTDMMKSVLKSKGVTFVKGGSLTTNTLLKSIRRDVLQEMSPQTGYILLLESDAEGHAVAIRAEANALKFYDPNFGEFVFPKINGQGDAMAIFLSTFISTYYPQFNKSSIFCFSLK